jgi:hypothetical protein
VLADASPPAFSAFALLSVVRELLEDPKHAKGGGACSLSSCHAPNPNADAATCSASFQMHPMSLAVVKETRLGGEEAGSERGTSSGRYLFDALSSQHLSHPVLSSSTKRSSCLSCHTYLLYLHTYLPQSTSEDWGRGAVQSEVDQ